MQIGMMPKNNITYETGETSREKQASNWCVPFKKTDIWKIRFERLIVAIVLRLRHTTFLLPP